MIDVPDGFVVKINSILYKYLWNWGGEKVKRSVLIRNIKSGGLKMPDLDTKITSWKSLWIRQILQSTNIPIWAYILENKIGLKCSIKELFGGRLDFCKLNEIKK